MPDEKFCGYVNIEFEEVSIDVSGDVDFNFSSDSNTRKWQKRKYEYYLNIIEEDKYTSDEDKNRAKELLSYCEQRMFSPCNMSIMVRTGGMNNVKGKLSQDVHALDRFDVFVYVLDDYLSKPKENRNQMHIIVRRHIVGGANCTLISALSPPRLCRIGTCRRLQTG